MALFVDSSAFLGRWIAGPWRALIIGTMAADHDWCASALALTEATAVADRLDDPAVGRRLRRLLRDDWDHYWTVPVDQRCLDRAADLARDHPARTVDALHLAAADRLPRPLIYLTFDPHQIPVALALGFEVVSTLAGTAVRDPSTATGRHPGSMAWDG
ncbi:MAG: type II toxin-antitoxin system VapC family toxin [Acidimicrobiales bacterium]